MFTKEDLAKYINSYQEEYDGKKLVIGPNFVTKNVIDLMADFTVQGIEISHPIPKYQRIFRKWFKMVKGQSRSERIMNMFQKRGVEKLDTHWQENIFEVLMNATKYCSLGQITAGLFEVGGQYRRNM
jgi:hypothetical protein